MTLWAALACSLLRSLGVCIAGVWLAHRLLRWLESLTDSQRPFVWIVLLVPALSPTVLSGYCYRDTAMSLVRHPLLVEGLYLLIVAAQGIPLAALLLRFAPPPPVSATAMHAAHLLAPRGLDTRRLWLSWHSRSTLPAASLLFLLTFQEADLAALLRTASWTEWLFTRHLGGLPVDAAVRSAAIPVLVQLPCLWGALAWWDAEPAAHNPPDSRPVRAVPASGLATSWVAVSWIVVVLIPCWQLLRGARQGWPALLQQPSTWREISDALLLAVTAGCLAWCLGTMILRNALLRRKWVTSALLACGLPGSLSLGLFLAGIFQTAPLLPAYDTPVPLIVGLTLILLPRSLILLTLLSRMHPGSGAHVLRMLERGAASTAAQRQLSWRVRGVQTFITLTLLCGWGYLEVMLPSILAPPGMVPVGMVLYNSLHYGRISALAAKLLLALLIPGVTLAAYLGVRRLR